MTFYRMTISSEAKCLICEGVLSPGPCGVFALDPHLLLSPDSKTEVQRCIGIAKGEEELIPELIGTPEHAFWTIHTVDLEVDCTDHLICYNCWKAQIEALKTLLSTL
jgi:hypothetical protein